MTNLNWREVAELHLHDAVIPDPRQPSRNRDQLSSVRVAVDGAFLHVDPRASSDLPSDDEFDVYVVPESAVRAIRYRTKGQ